MKKQIFIFVLAFLPFVLNAQQFNNAGFESWSSGQVQSWNSLGYRGFNLCDISQSTDANSGEYAVKIAPKMLPSSIAGLIGMSSFPVPGFLTNATVDMTGFIELLAGQGDISNIQMDQIINLLRNGLSISDRPLSIQGAYKYVKPQSEAEEICLLQALLVSNQNGERTFVGLGTASDIVSSETADGEFAQFNMPITYLSETPADELIFIVCLLADNSQTSDFAYLVLDDIQIQYASGMEEPSLDKDITLYPNPTDNEFRIKCEDGSDIVVYNCLGQVEKEINNYISLTPLSIEKPGIYFVKINNAVVKKLVIK